MPEYTIRDADTGKELKVRGAIPPTPSDMEELFADHYASKGPRIPEGEQSTIGEEISRGIRQLGSASRTGISSIFGDPEEAALAGIERSKAIGESYGEAPSFQRIKDIAEDEGVLSAAVSGVGQVPRALAGQAGVIGTALGGARLGAAVTPPVLPIVGPLAKPIGALIGGATALGAQFLGSNVQRQAEAQQERGEELDIDVARAARGAALQSLTETAGTGFVLGKRLVKSVLNIAEDVPLTGQAADSLRKVANRSIARSMGRGAVRGAAAEVPVEVAQSVIERDQAGLDLLSDEALEEYGEAAYMAATVGGSLGSGANAFAPSSARAELGQQESEEAEAAGTNVAAPVTITEEDGGTRTAQKNLDGSLTVIFKNEAGEVTATQTVEGAEAVKLFEDKFAEAAAFNEAKNAFVAETPKKDSVSFDFEEEVVGEGEATVVEEEEKDPNFQSEEEIYEQSVKDGEAAAAIAEAAEAAEAEAEAAAIAKAAEAEAAAIAKAAEAAEAAEAAVVVAGPEEETLEGVKAELTEIAGDIAPVEVSPEEGVELAAEEQAIDQTSATEINEDIDARTRTAGAINVAEAPTAEEIDAYLVSPEIKAALKQEFGGKEEFDAEGKRALNDFEGVENLPENVLAQIEEASANLDPKADVILAKRLRDGENKALKNTAPANSIRYYLNNLLSPKASVRMLAYDLVTLSPEATVAETTRVKNAEKYIRTLPKGGAILDAQITEIREDIAARDKNSETIARLNKEYGAKWAEEVKEQSKKVTRAEVNEAEKAAKARLEADQAKQAAEVIEEGLAYDPNVPIEVVQETVEKVEEDLGGADALATPTNKEEESRQIEAQTAAFLKQGGAITQALRLDAVAASSMPVDTAIFEQLAQGNLRGALDILGQSVNPKVRKTARALRNAIGNTKIELVEDLVSPEGVALAGLYNPQTDTIQINSSVPIAIHTLIHEAGHATTSHILANPSHPLTRKLTAIYEASKVGLSSSYGSTSLDEFVSEFLGNPNFANELASYTEAGTKKNLWQRIVDAFASFFGIKALKTPNAQQKVEEYIGSILSPAPAYRDAGVMYSLLEENREAELSSLLVGGGKGLSSSGVTETSMSYARGSYEGLSDKARAFFLNSVSLNNIADLVSQKVPAVSKLLNVLREQAGARNKLLDAHKLTMKELHLAFKGDLEGRKALDELVMNSTRGVDNDGGVDPLDPIDLRDSKGRMVYNKEQRVLWRAMQPLVARLKKKPEQLKAYKTMRDAYSYIDKKTLEALDTRLRETIGDKEIRATVRNKIVRDIIGKNKIRPYFPLYRDGSHWLEYKFKGEYYVASFDSRGQRIKAIAQLKRNGATAIANKNRTEIRERIKGIPTSTVATIYNEILPALKDDAVAAQKLQDILFDVLPEQALLQGYKHREGTLGFEEDSIGVFEKKMPSLITSLTNIEFDIPLTEAATQIKEQALEHPDSALVQDVLRATVGVTSATDRRSGKLPSYLEFSKNPYIADWARSLKSLAFFGTLGFNVSSIAVNLTNIPVVGMPYLAARYGPIKATRMILSSMKEYMGTGYKRETELFPTVDANGNTVNEKVTVRSGLSLTNDPAKLPNYAPLADMFIRYGLDSRTLASDMFDLENPSNTLLNKTQAASGFLFNHAERANRQIFAMAVYKLEMEKQTKKKFGDIGEEDLKAHGEQAAQTAIDSTEEINSSALLTSAPRFSQGDIGSLVFMYKRYPSAILAMQAKMFKSLLNDMTRKRQRALAAGEIDQVEFDRQAQEASILRKQLIHQYASAGAFAGVAGVPLYGVVQMAFNTFLLDDDEEDFDTIVSKAIGEGAMSGIFNNYLNISVADRISQTNLMVRNRANYEPDSRVEHFLETFGGPVVGIGMRWVDGMSSLAEGGEAAQRGAERLLPAFVANSMKSYRYATKGAVSMRGDEILQGTMKPGSLFAQALGFAPADYTKQLEINSLNKRVDRNIAEARTKILRKYYKSLRDGDLESLSESREELNAFNRRHPSVAITAETIERSIAQHGRTSAQTRQLRGITVNKRRMSEVLRSNAEFGDEWM